MIIIIKYVPGNKHIHKKDVVQSYNALLLSLKQLQKPPKALYNPLNNDIKNDNEYNNKYKPTINANDFDPEYYINGNEPHPINNIFNTHPTYLNIHLDDDKEVDIPVPTIPLQLSYPIKEYVTAAADTCSNINAIGAKTALKYKEHVQHVQKPLLINTGKGVLECYDYVNITMDDNTNHIFCVIYDLPFDYLIGRKLINKMGYHLTRIQYTNYFIHNAKNIEDDEINHFPNHPDINNMIQKYDIDINELVHGHKYNPKVEPFILELLKAHQSDIAGHEFDSGIIKNYIFRVPLNDESCEPVQSKEYRIPLAAKEELNRQLQKLRKYGFIRDSTSKWSSPTFVVPKKTGDWRIVFDYRKVNALSKKLKYPIPDINFNWYKFRGKDYNHIRYKVRVLAY